MSEDVELPVIQFSVWAWYLKSLGFRYVALLPLVTLASLLLILKIAPQGNANNLTASLSLIVPLPALVGLFSVVDSLIAGFSCMGCNPPTAAEYADMWAMALVGPQVGMWLTLPGLLLTTGLLYRRALANTDHRLTRKLPQEKR